MNTFVEMLTFQVKPDKVEDFEAFLDIMKLEMAQREGCLSVRCFKRLYTFDGVEYYQPPRQLTKIVKCVKYYAYWEFDSIESSGKAQGWFFENPARQLGKYTIMPFDINSGYSM